MEQNSIEEPNKSSKLIISLMDQKDNDEENGIFGGGPPRLRWDPHNKFSIRKNRFREKKKYINKRKGSSIFFMIFIVI